LIGRLALCAKKTLHNAHHHIQSGRRGRGLRAAAASKLICTGRVATPVVVSFDELAVDITSVTPTTVVPACDVMYCGAIKRHCSVISEVAILILLHVLARRHMPVILHELARLRTGVLACPMPGVLRAGANGRMRSRATLPFRA
jgi:hypothetical protein